MTGVPLLHAIAATWLAWMAGVLIRTGSSDFASLAIAAVLGAALICVGFMAASRTRRLASVPRTRVPLLAALAISIGAAMGLGNLAANWLIAQAHPVLDALLERRVTTLDPWIAIVGAPIVEEIALRLFLLSALVWILMRVTRRAGLAFAVALVLSSVLFALLHLARPMPESTALANFYRVALVIKYTLTALPLGWLFWRWGLPYAILGHAAGNAAHLVAQRFVF